MSLTSPYLVVNNGTTVLDVRKATLWALQTGTPAVVGAYVRGTPQNLVPEPTTAFYAAKQTDVNTSPFVK